jgi:ABC-type branched-subunit amino acid transport system ATPase component
MSPNNVIAEIRRQGVTVLMVEQNAAVARRMLQPSADLRPPRGPE